MIHIFANYLIKLLIFITEYQIQKLQLVAKYIESYIKMIGMMSRFKICKLSLGHMKAYSNVES